MISWKGQGLTVDVVQRTIHYDRYSSTREFTWGCQNGFQPRRRVSQQEQWWFFFQIIAFNQHFTKYKSKIEHPERTTHFQDTYNIYKWARKMRWQLMKTLTNLKKFKSVCLEDYEMLSIVALRAWLCSQFPDCAPCRPEWGGRFCWSKKVELPKKSVIFFSEMVGK